MVNNSAAEDGMGFLFMHFLPDKYHTYQEKDAWTPKSELNIILEL